MTLRELPKEALDRGAIVYVRQSTGAQVQEPRSQRQPYALAISRVGTASATSRSSTPTSAARFDHSLVQGHRARSRETRLLNACRGQRQAGDRLGGWTKRRHGGSSRPRRRRPLTGLPRRRASVRGADGAWDAPAFCDGRVVSSEYSWAATAGCAGSVSRGLRRSQ